MLQKYGCVVFDLDGTLADTSADLLASANACFRGEGLGDLLTAADTLTAFHGGRAMLRLGFARVGRATDEDLISRWYPVLLEHYAAAIAVHTQMYPGAVAAVETLKQAGLKVAICTNKPAALAEQLMRALGVRDLFDALVGADTLPVRKPDPAPYRLALAQAGAAGPSMLIGDTETDFLTARAAGVPIALVTFGPEGQGISRLSPDHLLHDYSDLPQMAAATLR